MAVKLRPAVQKFAEVMETVLRMHDEEKGKEGWKGISPRHFLTRLREEVDEIEEALDTRKRAAVVEGECADVANIAMMLACTVQEEDDKNDAEEESWIGNVEDAAHGTCS